MTNNTTESSGFAIEMANPSQASLKATRLGIPEHAGKHHVNQTLEWLPTDTKESYEKLIQDPEHRAYFVEQGWDQPGAGARGVAADAASRGDKALLTRY